MSSKSYNEKEVAQIIRRAAELESYQQGNQKTTTDKNRPGLTFDDLTTLAVESGLDPENIRKAIYELEKDTEDSGKKSTPKRMSNGEIFTERWIDGTLNDEICELIIADLNHRYDASNSDGGWISSLFEEEWSGDYGVSKVRRTGKSLEWKYANEYGSKETRVLIQPRGEQIRIRISKKKIWGSDFSNIDEDVFDYLAYIPWIAGGLVLFTLPYSFWLNAILAILSYATLEILLTPIFKKVKEKWSFWMGSQDSSKSEKDVLEIEDIANDLVVLIGEESSFLQKHKLKNVIYDSPEEEHKTSSQSGSGLKNKLRQS